MQDVNGATLLAQNLKSQGVDFMFGIVGFPVFGVAAAAQKAGIKFIGMRNEQSASYAAQAASYLVGRPQACLVVSGPGVIHALAGLANAEKNCWPMILIGGASPTYQSGMGAFQEENQVELTKPYCKYSASVDDASRIPFYVEKAIRTSIYGRPGPVYLDMPDNIINQQVGDASPDSGLYVGSPPATLTEEKNIEAALNALESAERPLVIVGKGMAWARAEREVRTFIERTQLPFLASPMGKGVLNDDSPLSVGAARSTALRDADVIFLMGARLNWIMHFGLPPRFNKDVKVIQLDIAAEEIGSNVKAEVGLVGDGKSIVGQLNKALLDRQWFYPKETSWRTQLAEKAIENGEAIKPMSEDNSIPMNYYRAYRDIQEWIPKDALIIGEGANTMDIGRTQISNHLARHRLDAGTYGTMGVGLGFAIGATAVYPDKPVVAIQGDSAFGFSGMEIETACRHNLPIKIVVLNNGGIGMGLEQLPTEEEIPAFALMPGAPYEKIMEAFGGKGIYVEDPAELRKALDEALAFDGPALVNVKISPTAGRKSQQFNWLTT